MNARDDRTSARSMSPSIEIHIETLVVEGLGALHGATLEAAVRDALAAHLQGSTAIAALVHTPRIASIDAGSIHVAAAPRAEVVGAEIGRAIHGALAAPLGTRNSGQTPTSGAG